MDPENFADVKIDGYFAQMVEYVFKLYENTILEHGNQKKAAAGRKEDLDTYTDTESGDKEIDKVDKEDNQDTVLVNDHMMSFFRQIQDKDRNNTED
jgi:hypothetical protein